MKMILYKLIIIITLITSTCYAQEPQTLYIAIDNTLNSQMLKRELEADWRTRLNPSLKEILTLTQTSEFQKFSLKMNRIRSRIGEFWKIKFVDYDDVRSPSGTYPLYRIGKYREWKGFDSLAFSEVSYPLKTVEFLYEQWYYQDFIDNILKEYQNRFDKWLYDRNDIYSKWLKKAQKENPDPDKTSVLWLGMSQKHFESYNKELEDKKLTREYTPKIPKFKPLKKPYE